MLKHLLLAGILVTGRALKINIGGAAQVFLNLPLPGFRVGHERPQWLSGHIIPDSGRENSQPAVGFFPKTIGT